MQWSNWRPPAFSNPFGGSPGVSLNYVPQQQQIGSPDNAAALAAAQHYMTQQAPAAAAVAAARQRGMGIPGVNPATDAAVTPAGMLVGANTLQGAPIEAPQNYNSMRTADRRRYLIGAGWSGAPGGGHG